ncbi:MAG: serine/threonine protein kinase [Deltaproteobacteria bacterium]|nr:serine/threonine protein kinase [Deltaproteobacteria bacterium]
MDRRDLTGTTIAGRYRVMRRIGQGGMGAVFLVQHTESLQQYALKTLHVHAASDRLAVERFLREARAAAALRSKNVVRVVDAQMSHVDEHGHPLPFLVMELLEGANLEQIVQSRGRLDPEEVVWVLRGVARALDVAHGRGIVHRDLKPENVFVALDDDGEPIAKVCDFGIAKLAGDEAGLMMTGALGTQTGTTVGTPMYMAPEQARSSTDVVVQTDQWALGLIAFKALTGREYFSTARTTTELLLKIVNDPLDPPSIRMSALPPAFDAWFFRACERDPMKRFASAGEQVAALAEVLSVTEPRPPPVPKSESNLAVAETVDVASLAPRPISSGQATTASPSSRTMDDNITRVPLATPPRRSAWVFVFAGVLALAGVVGGALTLRRPDASPASSNTTTAPPSNMATASTPVTTSKAAASEPVKTAEPSSTASPPATAPAAKTAATSMTKVTTPATAPKATTTASAATTASTAPKATATSTPAPEKGKLPKGAPCSRSNECASGYCIAEACN